MTAPRTPEDVRRDPQPGDRWKHFGTAYALAVTERRGAEVFARDRYGGVVCMDLILWSALLGTFTPGPGVPS
mgnify:CR=1 FL=1